MALNLGIVDIRKLVGVIQENYNIDFSDYALTTFKRRIEIFAEKNKIPNFDILLKQISQKFVFEEFLDEVVVSDSEMFRDPMAWIYLVKNILPKLLSESSSIKVWFPEVSSGEELYTLSIILREERFNDFVKLVGTSLSPKKLAFVKKGLFDTKKMEIGDANYTRYAPNRVLSNYYDVTKKGVQMDKSLLSNVELNVQNIHHEAAPNGVKLIIFRNRVIYFNAQLQQNAIDIMHNALLPGGYFMIGINEMIDSTGMERRFSADSNSEKIFKKISV